MNIAEIGLNHLGDYKLAEKYVRELCLIEELDGMTFQVREKEHREKKPELYFDFSYYEGLCKLVEDSGKSFGVAISDGELISFFESVGVHFYKVIRDGVFKQSFLESLGKTGKKILISVGLCDHEQLLELVEFLTCIEGDFVLIYTNRKSVELKNLDVTYMDEMKNHWDKVGYGSHCEDPSNLILVSSHSPSDILFYVKDDKLDVEFPDNIWAIGLSQVASILKAVKKEKSLK